jgi:hypothetical protein
MCPGRARWGQTRTHYVVPSDARSRDNKGPESPTLVLTLCFATNSQVGPDGTFLAVAGSGGRLERWLVNGSRLLQFPPLGPRAPRRRGLTC